MRPKGTADQLEARRRQALALLEAGWLMKDVAEALSVSRQSLWTWQQEGVAAKPQHVPQCRLSEKQRAKLVKLLRAGPRKAGFDSDLWTTRRVAELIEREFGVAYHSTHAGRLMHQLGFSCQKPQRRSREQDPQAVKNWRERQWPRIKKGGSGAS
jgi:transposase